MGTVTLRFAEKADAGMMMAIYAPFVLETTATWETAVPPRPEFEARMERCSADGLPWLVAEEGGVLIGFGDITADGYLDRLYVHHLHQRQGVAAALCDRLEETVKGPVTTHASITARPFFEKRGYQVLRAQQVERRGILLTNYIMEKTR